MTAKRHLGNLAAPAQRSNDASAALPPVTLRSRLFLKYVALLFAVVGISLAVNSLFEIWFTYRDHKALLFRVQREQATAAAERIGQFIADIQNQVGWATQLPLVEGTFEERLFEVRKLLYQVPAITELAQIDSFGHEQLRVSQFDMDVLRSGADYSNKPEFGDAVSQKVYYGPIYFRRDSEPYMTLSVAGRRRDSGVSVAQVNLKLIWEVISKIKVRDRGRAYVVDISGRLIADPDVTLVLRNTNVSHLAQVRAARADNPDERVREVDDITGNRVLAASAPVPALGWIVFVETPIKDAYAPLYATLQRTFLVLLAALVLAFIAGLFLARRMVIPIRALTIGAARIGSGELGQRINIRTGDELESLARQFNYMAERLHESYSSLQKKVDERTQDLNVSNLKLRELNQTLEQRVIAETRERLQIWNVSEDLLVVAGLQGIFLSVNPAWTTKLGWSEAELLGKSAEWLLHPEDQRRARSEIEHVAAGNKTSRFESRYRAKDGSYHWISWNAAADGARIYAMGRDVTELRRTEDELRGVRHELAQAARRTTLAATTAAIAHEIKQPLGAIVTNAGAALRWLQHSPPDLEEVRGSIQNIAADGHRASEVIQSIRSMFSESSQLETLLEINQVTREAISLVRAELDAANIAVHADLGEGLPAVSAHKGQLLQVLLNLISNAVDAMREIDGRVLSVKTELAEPNDILLSVKDTGTGIDPTKIDRLFEAFYTTKADGMGMGLAICRSIIETHGGTLGVEHAEPRGAVFRIILPRGQACHQSRRVVSNKS
jgi:PAS domain S-box-containing protein